MTPTVPAKVEPGALVVRGDALSLPLRDNSVDLIISSPPYFALRSYSTGHEMEIGSEATPHAYLEALWTATREMIRVLKPTGSIWINLGDKYAGNATGGALTVRSLERMTNRRVPDSPTRTPYETAVREKSLMGLPWRYAIGCIDQLGLILRRDLIWSKPNGLPESVTDRPRSSHEYWFMFVKSPRYFAALDELRQPYSADASDRRAKYGQHPGRDGLAGLRATGAAQHGSNGVTVMGVGGGQENPLGKLPGSVWSIPSEPLRLPPWIDTQHYAAFPTEWPRRLILGFTPHGICQVCGVGRFPVVDRQYEDAGGTGNERYDRRGERADVWDKGTRKPQEMKFGRANLSATILGYACACTPHTDHPERRGASWNNHGTEDAVKGSFPNHREDRLPVREYHLDRWSPPPTHPAIILDPFSGTGTTAMVARALGRIGIGVDLSHDYCRAARWRTSDPGQAGKAISRTNLERQVTLL